MPTPADVRHELTDILTSVVGTDPADVVDDADLRELGVDSLAAVEVADELGRRFGIHIPDATVDATRTVADAVRAVTEHDPTTVPHDARRTPVAPAGATRTSTTLASAPAPPRSTEDGTPRHPRSNAFWRLALWFLLAGAAIGLAIGFGSALLVRATGVGGVDLPPIAAPSSEAPTPSPSAEPEPEPEPEPEEEPEEREPTFEVADTQVAPGQRFGLSGRFPDLDDGEELQVQVRDPGGDWDEFPVTVRTQSGGTYETQIYTSRTGEREFRMLHPGTDTTTDAVTVQIG